VSIGSPWQNRLPGRSEAIEQDRDRPAPLFGPRFHANTILGLDLRSGQQHNVAPGHVPAHRTGSLCALDETLGRPPELRVARRE
jgi:hypothetical protein